MLHFFLTYYHLQTLYKNIYIKLYFYLINFWFITSVMELLPNILFFFSCIYFYATFTLQVNLNLYTCKFYSFKQLF